MILQRPTPSTLAAAAAVAAAALPAQAAGGDVAADAAARNTTETWQQYTASIPFYPVHHPCDTSCGGHTHDADSPCVTCRSSWASHDPNTHACPAGTGRGSFDVQVDVFVTCDSCGHSMCEACLKPSSTSLAVPLISLLALTRTVTIRHAALTCRDYFIKVQSAHDRARSSSALKAQASANMTPYALRCMLAASGAKECPACGLPGTHGASLPPYRLRRVRHQVLMQRSAAATCDAL